MEKKVIGILGGMGPEATVFLFKRIVEVTGAIRDQDHIRIIIDNNPKIPDRTPAILGRGESPVPLMVSTARNLEHAGADFIVIPCVSAHHFIDSLQEAISIPILSIFDAVIAELRRNSPTLDTVGLLATTGTIIGGHFQRCLEDAGYVVKVPTPSDQEKLVMDAIYGERGIKAGFLSPENQERLVEASRGLVELGAQGIIAGCTEVPLVLSQEDLSVPFFDCLLILARESVKEATEGGLLTREKGGEMRRKHSTERKGVM
jgi:aspartate racemase